jgi:glycerate 2-kinase
LATTAFDVIAAGKAAAPMLLALRDQLGHRWRSALAIAPRVEPQEWPRTTWLAAAHPVPDERSEAAGRKVLARAAQLGANDLLLVLLSGGASSLMAVPVDGVSLADKRTAQSMLLAAGADIRQLNAVRKHLSRIKGGGLAAATPARVATLAISDVVGDDLSTIGSGPTVADATTYDDALTALEQHGGVSRYPASVSDHLLAGARGERPETKRTFDPSRVQAHVIGSVADAVEAASASAVELGYRVQRLPHPTVGEARLAGGSLLRAARRAAAEGRPCCVIAGGETTVRVTGGGRGGRNQELVLAMVAGLVELGPAVAMSVGTDGVDGPTDAAGALADSDTSTRARSLGLSSEPYLKDNNSYAFFDALGDLVKTGPTGTNVGDIQIVLMSQERAVRP